MWIRCDLQDPTGGGPKQALLFLCAGVGRRVKKVSTAFEKKQKSDTIPLVVIYGKHFRGGVEDGRTCS